MSGCALALCRFALTHAAARRPHLATSRNLHKRPPVPTRVSNPARRHSETLGAIRPPHTSRRSAAYPLFECSRPRNVCVRFCRATASTVMNCYDSFDICMETTTLHAHFEGRPTNRLRKSCGSAQPYRQEKLRARALHDENGRGGPMLPPGCCSRFVWPTRSTSLLVRAPIVVCSRGSQQKYCVALKRCLKKLCVMSTCYSYRPNGSEFT